MLSLRFVFNLILFLLLSSNIQAHSEQKIKDFYISNFKEDGSRDWEVEGIEAIIYDKHVDIDKMKAHYYLKDDTILITSDKARLDKGNMDVYLKDNVYIENKDGANVMTDSLNWQRQKNHIDTKDWVKVRKDSMQVEAKGLSADTQLRKADFTEDVEVTFPDEKTKQVTTVTCTGPLEIEYGLGKAVFNKNVVATHPQGKMFSDKATLYFDPAEKVIIKIVSEGNVKIIRDENTTFSQKATYLNKEQKVILEGRPRLIYYQQDDGKSEKGLFD